MNCRCWSPTSTTDDSETTRWDQRYISLLTTVGSKQTVPVDCGAAVRALDSQSRESRFQSSCCRFETLAISFIPRCHSSVSCITEYLSTVSNCSVSECSAEKSQLRWNEQVCQGVKCNVYQGVKCKVCRGEMHGLPGGDMQSALNSPKDWIPRFIRT